MPGRLSSGSQNRKVHRPNILESTYLLHFGNSERCNGKDGVGEHTQDGVQMGYKSMPLDSGLVSIPMLLFPLPHNSFTSPPH